MVPKTSLEMLPSNLRGSIPSGGTPDNESMCLEFEPPLGLFFSFFPSSRECQVPHGGASLLMLCNTRAAVAAQVIEHQRSEPWAFSFFLSFSYLEN